MKNYISIIAASLMIVSCVDTVIIPDDKTVDEDFWKSKSDVQLMVNGAYQAMLSENVLSKLIVWGGLRSDEMIPIDNLTSDVRDDLRDLADVLLVLHDDAHRLVPARVLAFQMQIYERMLVQPREQLVELQMRIYNRLVHVHHRLLSAFGSSTVVL